MAIGFTILNAESYNSTGANIQVIPDNVMSRNSTGAVLVAAFGDGYEQRASYGINSVREGFEVTFSQRAKSEIDDIVDFFESKRAVTAFTFTVPNSNESGNEEAIKVVCEDYSTSYLNSEFYSCSATLRRVYEP